MTEIMKPSVETIETTPHWPAMFDYAVQLTRDRIGTDEGQEFLVEMLQFGKRLYLAQSQSAIIRDYSQKPDLTESASPRQGQFHKDKQALAAEWDLEEKQSDPEDYD